MSNGFFVIVGEIVGAPFTVPAQNVTLEGATPVQVRWVRLDGVENYLDWTGATAWRVALPLHRGKNLLNLQFLDYDKNLVGTASIEVTAPLGTGVSGWKSYPAK